MINTAVDDSERVARGLVRLAQSHRQICADFLRDHPQEMDTPAVAKFAARIRMFDRMIASASLALSNLPDDSNDRHAMLRATIGSMAEDAAYPVPQPDPFCEQGAAVPGPQDADAAGGFFVPIGTRAGSD
jgi:hypothetical protein